MRRLVVVLLVAGAFDASAQAFYKWTDEQGKAHYGDRPPKGFTGKVERVEVDTAPASAPNPALAPASPAPSAPRVPAKDAKPWPDAKPDGYIDINARRKANRERLRGEIDAAEARLVQARARLQEGGATQDHERQVIQQMAGRPGSLPASGRSNCRTVKGADGKPATMCPAVIPNEAYYERQRGLEEAVRQAEADLDRAKEAYRRGVD